MEEFTFFEQMADTFHLGAPTRSAVRVTGGLMHTMYRLDTALGTYAVKLLNRTIMKRPDAKGNYAQADALEALLEQSEIPMVPALVFHGQKMQELSGQYFYIYKWYDGHTRKGSQITALHCQKISRVLARIHAIDRKPQAYQPAQLAIDWDFYLERAAMAMSGAPKTQAERLHALLRQNRNLLYALQDKANAAQTKIPPVVAICHNDMDCKNVLWRGGAFKIIDFECLSYANPYLELVELALGWSGYEQCSIDLALFSTFIHTYFNAAPKPTVDWKAICDSNCGRLEWLAYNVRRALRIECDSDEECALGAAQVSETLRQIVHYNAVQDEILHCLANTNQR